MKKELIKTPNYLLVVDDVGRQFAHLSLNGSPILEGVPLLPPIEEGWGIEKEACEYFLFPITTFKEMKRCSQNYALLLEQFGDDVTNDYMSVKYYIAGYKKARQKYKFTEEDVMEFCNKLQDCTVDDSKALFNEFVLSNSQPKTPTHFEFEMEEKFADGYTEDRVRRFYSSEIKTLTNPQGQIVACGKYIYEL